MTAPRPQQSPGLEIGYRIRSLIARHRYVNSVTRELSAMLRDAHRRAAERVLAGSLDQNRDDRMRAIASDADQMLKEAYPRARRHATTQFSRYAAVEREVAKRIANPSGFIPELAVELAAIPETLRDLNVHGHGFNDWWDNAASDAIRRMRRELQFGFASGENYDALARRLYASDKAKGAAQVWRGSRTALRVAVQSIGTAVHSRAVLAGIEFDQKRVTYVFHDVVHDNRNSIICIAIRKRAKVYRSDDPALPVPPLHMGCRTSLMVVPKDFKPDGDSYDEYLASLSVQEQNDILGKGRAQLWRDAKVSLAELIDDDNRPFTLEELRTVLNAF